MKKNNGILKTADDIEDRALKGVKIEFPDGKKAEIIRISTSIYSPKEADFVIKNTGGPYDSYLYGKYIKEDNE